MRSSSVPLQLVFTDTASAVDIVRWLEFVGNDGIRTFTKFWNLLFDNDGISTDLVRLQVVDEFKLIFGFKISPQQLMREEPRSLENDFRKQGWKTN